MGRFSSQFVIQRLPPSLMIKHIQMGVLSEFDISIHDEWMTFRETELSPAKRCYLSYDISISEWVLAQVGATVHMLVCLHGGLTVHLSSMS